MRIAFHAPMKPPDHAVPSGDREMARLLMRALGLSGHAVEVPSRLRSYMAEPDGARLEALEREAEAEAQRIGNAWRRAAAPDLWFSYHSYYKAPDLLGPLLAGEFGVPIVTVESSFAGKRDADAWAPMQAAAMRVVDQARLNLCLTARDRPGLARRVGPERLAVLSPFVDNGRFPQPLARPDSRLLVTVAMMRPGDKLESYRMLARSLACLDDLDWTLRIVGDGPVRPQVMELFAAVAPRRIAWLGEVGPEAIPPLLDGAIGVWPGFGEAYGLAYLEAQAAGMPVVAQSTAGVPEVVRDGVTGLLVREGDADAYATALRSLLADPERIGRMGRAARDFVLAERSLAFVAGRLSEQIARACA